MSVHLQATAVVHGLLLLLKLAHLLADGGTLRDGTIIVLALLSVDTQKGPDSFTDSTAALNLDSAYAGVLQVILHLGAISRRARLGIATRGMLDQLNMQHEVSLTLQSFFIGETTAILACLRFDGDRHESVGASATIRFRIFITILAQIVIRTRVAVVTLAAKDLAAASYTLLDEFGCITIVQMPKDHH